MSEPARGGFASGRRSSSGLADVRPGLLLALLLVVVAAVYAPALGGGYLFDDRMIVITSPLVEELHPLLDYFSRPFFTSAVGEVPGYYRPLVVLSFAIDYRLHGGAASGLHLSNLVLHLVNTALFAHWLRRRGSGTESAIALAALWALHPRLTEAAAWISGRTDVMATTFVLAALVVWRPTSARRVASALLLLAGLLAKETALAGVAALLCNEWADQRSRQEPRALARACARSLPFFTAFALYLALRVFAVGLGAAGHSLGFSLRAATVTEAVGRYSFDLALPWLPDAVQGRLGRPTAIFVLLGGLTLLTLLALLVRFRQRLRAEQAAPLALATVALGLALHLVSIPSRMVSADRFLYLPLVGLLAWAAPALERLWRARLSARLVTALLLVSFGFFSFHRSALWADEVGFWVAQYRRASGVELYVSSTELAAVFLRTGLYGPALALSRQGLQSGDASANDARANAALALARLGRTSEARRLFEELGERDKYADDLALLDLQEHRFTEAGERLAHAYGPRPKRRAQRELLKNVALFQAAHNRLQADPAFAASEAGLVLRAELATGMSRLDEAVRLWSEVAATTRSREFARRAIAELVRRHDPRAMQRALESVESRFGVMPDLESACEVRLAEVEAALSAARALKLLSSGAQPPHPRE